MSDEHYGMTDIVLQSISKVYGVEDHASVRALDHVDLSIEAGELLVVTGPSGSGKTTLLRLIAGLEAPTAGSIRIGGKTVNGASDADRDVGMVFQQPTLYPHLSVKENLSLGLKLRCLPASDIERRVTQMASLLGLESLLDRKPKALSGGQQQRVSIGRILVRRPKILLLDEPLSHLDPSLRDQLRREFSELQRQLRVTTLYVTHDQGEALSLGDRIAVLNEGLLQQVATPQAVYQQPTNLTVAQLIGSPPMNLIPVEAIPSSANLRLETLGHARLPLVPFANPSPHIQTPTRLLLGVRPEHIQLNKPNHSAPPPEWPVGTVERVQFHGAFEFVHCRIGNDRLVSLSVPVGSHRTGDSVVIQFDARNVLLFDGETGRRLRWETPEPITLPPWT